MKLHKYKYINTVLSILVLIILFIPLLLKYNLKQLKTDKFSQDFLQETENIVVNEKASLSLYEIVHVIDGKKLLTIEEINIKEEGKEVVLTCLEEVNNIKDILSDVKELEGVKAIEEINYNEKAWSFKVLFQ